MTGTVDVTKVRKLVWDKSQGAFVDWSKTKTRNAVRFIKGPLPLEWLSAAAHQGGKALAVGLAVHYAAGLRTTSRDIPVTNELAEVFGVSRHTKRYALKRLAAAGLIAVTQEGKSSPRVTIVSRRGRPPARNQDSRARNGAVAHE
jgi:DNA-binding transcriptional ArsR family regulator